MHYTVSNPLVLDAIVGSRTRGKVLMYLVDHREGYARGMAAELGCALDTVQKQLKRLEKGGVISGRPLGRTTVYVLSPDYPLKRELEALLGAAQGIVEPAGSSSVREARGGTRSRVIIRRIE